MALANGDFQKIRKIVREEIRGETDPIKREVSGLKQDVGSLKQDVSGLKQDVGSLKQDVARHRQETSRGFKRLEKKMDDSVNYLDKRDLELRKRVTKLESVVGIATS